MSMQIINVYITIVVHGPVYVIPALYMESCVCYLEVYFSFQESIGKRMIREKGRNDRLPLVQCIVTDLINMEFAVMFHVV